MRIALLVGETLYPLAGADGVSERVHSSAADFELTPESVRDLLQLFRGEYAEPIDRGNLLQVIGFTTSRLFTTGAEAWIYTLDYDRLMPRSGTLVMDVISPTGIISRRHMVNAVVSPPVRKALGATAFLSYTVHGGEIQAVEMLTGNMVVASVDFPALDGVWENIGVSGGDRDAYSTGIGDFIQYGAAGPKWQLYRDGVAFLEAAEDVATPDLVTTWTELYPGTGTVDITITPEIA